MVVHSSGVGDNIKEARTAYDGNIIKLCYIDTHNTIIYSIIVISITSQSYSKCDVQNKNTLQSRFPVVKTKIDASNIHERVHNTHIRCIFYCVRSLQGCGTEICFNGVEEK